MSIDNQRAETAPRRGFFALAVFAMVVATVGAVLAPGPRIARAAEAATEAGTTRIEVNLRAGPSVRERIVLVIPVGGGVTVHDYPRNGFYPVTYGINAGWVQGVHLDRGDAGSARSGRPSGGAAGPSTGDPIVDIIYAAADRYGQPRADMLRVAGCESNLDPSAVNPAGSYGLFQFLPGTWATTPYASYDLFDPWANANAAGWMWSMGRRGEWVCQ